MLALMAAQCVMVACKVYIKWCQSPLSLGPLMASQQHTTRVASPYFAHTAAKLEDVLSEIFNVIKPGGLFLYYEWVSMKHFDAKPPDTLTPTPAHPLLFLYPPPFSHSCQA